jgi:hypothetical protein
MHEVIVSLLQAQIAEMREERKVVYDRLGAIGLGGPLFHQPPAEIEVAEQEPEPDPEKDAESVIQRLLALKRRPSKLAEALTRRNWREHNKAKVGPTVKWVAEGEPENPKLAAMFAEAEENGVKQGRKQA